MSTQLPTLEQARRRFQETTTNLRTRIQETRTRLTAGKGVLGSQGGILGRQGSLLGGSSNPGTIIERLEKMAPQVATVRKEGVRSLPVFRRLTERTMIGRGVTTPTKTLEEAEKPKTLKAISGQDIVRGGI